VILSSLAHCSTVAISFDPKVDWAMEDLGQEKYLLDIHDFTSEAVIDALDRIKQHKESVTEQLRSYHLDIEAASTWQYNALAELAIASYKRRNL
jgi:polysaccharide pyruvyl transferase WcaK-like protein